MEAVSNEAFFTLFYIVFAVFIILPPCEFVSAGITIPMLFSSILGSEKKEFVQFHIRRSSLTLLIYSLLPLGYLFGLWCFSYRQELQLIWNLEGSYFRNGFIAVAILLPLTAFVLVCYWARDKWKNHPITFNIRKACGSDEDLSTAVLEINTEFRRFDNLLIQSNVLCKILSTENWILKVMPLTVCVANQSHAFLRVCHSDVYNNSSDNFGIAQFVNLEIKPIRDMDHSFIIRLNINDYRSFQDHILHAIEVPPNISLHISIVDKFVSAFKKLIVENARYTPEQVLDDCLGCMQKVANIKLQKLCANNSAPDCTECNCRPLWCVDCMARWFALRQDEQHPETWVSSKCICPMCRATFCLQDVSVIDDRMC